MSYRTRLLGSATGVLLAATALTASLPGQASDTGAFIGGMLTTKVLGNMQQRTQAEQEQAYYAQQNAQQQQVSQAAPASAASSTKSTEQKLDELNKLAAGGYITPEEYKAKKQAIIDAM